jgi:hypothetical protein
MDMEVVEKGVETEEQMSMFCLEGCGLLQGHLFSQPVQASRAVSILRNAAPDNALVALSSTGRSAYLARLKSLVSESGIEIRAEASRLQLTQDDDHLIHDRRCVSALQ